MEDRRDVLSPADPGGGRDRLADRLRTPAPADGRLAKDQRARAGDVFRDPVGGRAGGRVLLSWAATTMVRHVDAERSGGADRRVGRVRSGASVVSCVSELALRAAGRGGGCVL